ncbi:MAG TPA: hypothetical protein GXX20_02655 [Clostridiaceae bacterium]|nr:hypothetical protein [Clostridiaceae bacterium]
MYQKNIIVKKTIDKTGGYELDRPIELEYYLLDSKANYGGKHAGEKVYGIGISKKVSDSCFEEMFVRDFCCCKETAIQAIDHLANHDVTPMGLIDIYEDILVDER